MGYRMIYSFADCKLDTRLYALERAGQTHHLRPKVFQVLIYLLDHRDQVVSKDELCKQVWPNQFISNSTLEGVVRSVRRAVGDSGQSQHIIKTLHGHGYQFIADVDVYDPSPSRQPLPSLQPPDFTGRERELTMLHEILRQVGSDRGRVVTLQGESGIGKSRLLSEFCDSLRDEPVITLTANCAPYGQNMPYGPVRQLVQQYCHLSPDDSEDRVRTQLFQCLQEASMEPEEKAPYLLTLLGYQSPRESLAHLRPETRKLFTLATLNQFFLSASRRQPIVVIVDDSDWIDRSSADWLISLMSQLDEAPLLLITSGRHEVEPAWQDHPANFLLSLAPLNPENSCKLVRSMFSDDAMPENLISWIHTQDTWNPFNLQQLIHLFAASQIDRSPPPLEELIAARMAQLPTATQHLVQCLSVLGPHCAQAMVQALWEGQDDLEGQLNTLQDQALCCASTQPATATLTYTLNHAMIEATVHNSLSHPEQQSLHAAAGQFLERLPARDDADVLNRIAYHYAHSADASKAIAYLLQCADQAAGYFAHDEALANLTTALELSARLPEAEQRPLHLDLTLRQVQSLYALGQFHAAAAALQEPNLKPSELRDPGLAGRYALLSSQIMSRLREWEASRRYAEQAIEAAKQGRDDVTAGQAHHVLAMAHYWFATPEEGITHSRKAVRLLAPSPERHALGMAYIVQSLSALMLGDFDTAMEASRHAIALADALGEPHLQTYAAWTKGWVSAAYGDWNEAIALCQRSLAYAPDALNLALAEGGLGYAYLEQGDSTIAITHLEKAVPQLQQFNHRRMEALYTIFLSQAYLLHEEPEKAEAHAQYGLNLSLEEVDSIGSAWAHRALGHIQQAGGAISAAQSHFHRALDTFIQCPARFEAGRTYLALAALAHYEGDKDTARQHLQAARDLFSISRALHYLERTEHQLAIQTDV